jgi:MFS family permease
MCSSCNSLSFQLIRDVGITHGNESQVGYYVGLMVRSVVRPLPYRLLTELQQSLFFVTQALTVLHWSRISDRIGRKPVILIGLFGLSLSMYSFGLSRTFWGFVLRYSLSLSICGVYLC